MTAKLSEEVVTTIDDNGTFVATVGVDIRNAEMPFKGNVVTNPADPLFGAVETPESGRKSNPGLVGPGRVGRVKKVIREAARLAFAERIPIAMDIIDGKPIRMQKIVRTKSKFVLDKSRIIEVENGESADNPEAYVWVEVVWHETADVPDRIKCLEMLGRMGGVNLPIEEDGEADEALRNATFAILID